MGSCNLNSRHQSFKRELRAYHDHINRKNRYNLPKIVGKLNLFEALKDDKEFKDSYELDREIPNSALTVLVKKGLYAIGDSNGRPLTEFKYQFIEGCLGDSGKIIRCITDEGKIEDFDVESDRIIENCCVGGGISTSCTCGNQTTVRSSEACSKPYHEINYDNVRKELHIPFLCGARVVDINKKKRKRKK